MTHAPQQHNDVASIVAFNPIASLTPHQSVVNMLRSKLGCSGSLKRTLEIAFPLMEPLRPYSPDAWAVDYDQETVFVLEVTDTNGLRSKTEKIVDLGLWLDASLWDLVVIEIDLLLGCRVIDWEQIWLRQSFQAAGRDFEFDFFLEGRPLFGA